MSGSQARATALAVLSTIWIGCPRESPPQVEPAPVEPATAPQAYVNHDPAVEYVGSARCADCHGGIAETFARTGMGRAFYRLTAETAIEDFTRNNELVVARTGLRYRMVARDGAYYMRQSVLDGRGGEWALDERRMTYVLGSGNHSRSYVTEWQGQLYQLPVCWYPRAKRWDPCPGFEHDSEHFRRHATRSCVFCHNGRMVGVDGTVSTFREPLPMGIDCERCHGPGGAHVARWASGAMPGGEADPTIVNPRRLPDRERIEVCFQCHFGDSKATERVSVPGTDLLDFRPGMRLGTVVEPFRYADPTRQDFGLSAQADRLVLSACYRESGGKLECLSCHNPHVSTYEPGAPADRFTRVCRSCHELADCTGPAEARRGTVPPDDCVSCHMRRAQPDDQLHTVMTDHWIRRTIDERSRDARASLRVVPEIADSFAGRPAGEQAFLRARARYLLSWKTADPRRRELWEGAARDFEAAIAAGYEAEEAWFFLGRCREYLGDRAGAIAALYNAVGRDDAAVTLATALAEGGRTDEALDVLRTVVARSAAHAGANAELGRLLAQGGRLDDALARVDVAVRAEPWNAALRVSRGMILAAQGKFDEARAALEDAVRLDPESHDAWDTYARVLAVLGAPEAPVVGGIAARIAPRGATAGAGR